MDAGGFDRNWARAYRCRGIGFAIIRRGCGPGSHAPEKARSERLPRQPLQDRSGDLLLNCEDIPNLTVRALRPSWRCSFEF
jgi:hypothetical protein